LKSFSHSEHHAICSANVIYHGFNSLQVCPVHSVVCCTEKSQLVIKKLVMILEQHQLWAKQCPVDLTVLFLCHELVSLNSSVPTNAKPTF